MRKTIKGKSDIERLSKKGNYYLPTPPGFYVHVTDKLSKIYRLRAKKRGERKNIVCVIGPCSVLPLVQAQEEAIRLYLAIKAGNDPNEARRKEREAKEKERARAMEESALRRLKLGRVFEEYLKTKPLARKTKLGYLDHTNRYLSDWLDLDMNSITPLMVQERFTSICAQSPATAKVLCAIHSAVFTFASNRYVDQRGRSLITGNPWTTVKRNGLMPTIEARETPIPPEKMSDWYKAVTSLSPDFTDCFLFLLFTGVRVSAAVSVNWQDIDYEAGLLTLTDTKQRREKKKRYQVPLTRQLEDLIQKRRKTATDLAYIFPALRDEHNTATPLLAKYARESRSIVGFDWTPHCIRKTFATEAAQLVTEHQLKALMNHASKGDITQTHYVKISPEALRKPMQAINDHLEALCKSEAPRLRKIENVNGPASFAKTTP